MVTNPKLWTFTPSADPDADRTERNRIFEIIKPAANWKMPIRATIDAADFDDANEAAIWFTGGGLEVVGMHLAPDGTKFFEVAGAGYYNNIGA